MSGDSVCIIFLVMRHNSKGARVKKDSSTLCWRLPRYNPQATLPTACPTVSLHNSFLSLVTVICRMCLAVSSFFLAWPVLTFYFFFSATSAVSAGQILLVFNNVSAMNLFPIFTARCDVTSV